MTYSLFWATLISQVDQLYTLELGHFYKILVCTIIAQHLDAPSGHHRYQGLELGINLRAYGKNHVMQMNSGVAEK